MKKKIFKIKISKIFFLVVLILGTIYLIIPAPADPPALPNSIRSQEPGDTVQIPGVSAYYTDIPRKEVVDFYFRYFSQSSFKGIPLLTYKLNHPPERIKEVLRDTQMSTFVEEIIHPFRESLFVSGYEWANDPFTPPKHRAQFKLLIGDHVYDFKITLFYQQSKTWQRLVVFYLSLLIFWFAVKGYKELIQRWQNK